MHLFVAAHYAHYYKHVLDIVFCYILLFPSIVGSCHKVVIETNLLGQPCFFMTMGHFVNETFPGGIGSEG